MNIGVLALQGDFTAHARILELLGASTRPVRATADLEGIHGLVLPGGESTAMLKLMERDQLDRAICDKVGAGLPVLATCAGVISRREVRLFLPPGTSASRSSRW